MLASQTLTLSQFPKISKYKSYNVYHSLNTRLISRSRHSKITHNNKYKVPYKTNKTKLITRNRNITDFPSKISLFEPSKTLTIPKFSNELIKRPKIVKSPLKTTRAEIKSKKPYLQFFVENNNKINSFNDKESVIKLQKKNHTEPDLYLFNPKSTQTLNNLNDRKIHQSKSPNGIIKENFGNNSKNNLGNILNSSQDKNLEINLNKYEIKILQENKFKNTNRKYNTERNIIFNEKRNNYITSQLTRIKDLDEILLKDKHNLIYRNISKRQRQRSSSTNKLSYDREINKEYESMQNYDVNTLTQRSFINFINKNNIHNKAKIKREDDKKNHKIFLSETNFNFSLHSQRNPKSNNCLVECSLKPLFFEGQPGKNDNVLSNYQRNVYSRKSTKHLTISGKSISTKSGFNFNRKDETSQTSHQTEKSSDKNLPLSQRTDIKLIHKESANTNILTLSKNSFSSSKSIDGIIRVEKHLEENSNINESQGKNDISKQKENNISEIGKPLLKLTDDKEDEEKENEQIVNRNIRKKYSKRPTSISSKYLEKRTSKTLDPSPFTLRTSFSSRTLTEIKRNNNININSNSNTGKKTIKPKRKQNFTKKKFSKQLSRISEISYHNTTINNLSRVNEIGTVLSSKSTKLLSQLKLPPCDLLIHSLSFKNKNTFTNQFLDMIIHKRGQSKVQVESPLREVSYSNNNSVSEPSSNKIPERKHSRIFSLNLNFLCQKKRTRSFRKSNTIVDIKNKKFISKLEKKMEDIINVYIDYCTEQKDTLLEKIIPFIDNNININYQPYSSNNVFQYNSEKIYTEIIDKAIQYNNTNIIEEKIFVKEIQKYEMQCKNESFFNLSKYVFISNYFDIDIYQLVYKTLVLKPDFETNKKEDTLINHFLIKDKNLACSTCKSLNRRKITTIFRANCIILLYEDQKFYNNFLFNDIPPIVEYLKRKKSFVAKPTRKNSINRSKQGQIGFKFRIAKGQSIEKNEFARRSHIFYPKKTLFHKKSLFHLYSNDNNADDSESDITYNTIINSIFCNQGRERFVKKKKSSAKKKMDIFTLQKQTKFSASPLAFIRRSSEPFIKHRLSLTRKNALNKNNMMEKTNKIKENILKELDNEIDQLFFFAKDGNYDQFVHIFSRYQINIEEKDTDGNTLLSLAVQGNNIKVVEFLLKKGANPNAQNNKLNSPLHYALGYKDFQLCDLLIKYGADEQLKNSKGLTPWQCLTIL